MPHPTKQLNKTKQDATELDAAGQVLGRFASYIAVILQGKDKPSYSPNLELQPVQVHVKNIASIKITGAKFTDKKYYRHSGYRGNLHTRTFQEEFERDPARVLERAVYNMLPKNNLRAPRMKRLSIE